MKITAYAHRVDGWWLVEVPDVAGDFAPTHRLDLIVNKVREAAAQSTGVTGAGIEVEVTPDLDPDVERILQQGRAARAESGLASRQTVAAFGYVARVLLASDFAIIEIAAVLGVTMPEARKLLKHANSVAADVRRQSRQADARKAEAMAPMKEKKAALAAARAEKLKVARERRGGSPSA